MNTSRDHCVTQIFTDTPPEIDDENTHVKDTQSVLLVSGSSSAAMGDPKDWNIDIFLWRNPTEVHDHYLRGGIIITDETQSIHMRDSRGVANSGCFSSILPISSIDPQIAPEQIKMQKSSVSVRFPLRRDGDKNNKVCGVLPVQEWMRPIHKKRLLTKSAAKRA